MAERFGKYDLVELLGEGGMGAVWKAWQSDLERWVALKFIKGGSEEEVKRFVREAQLSAKLAHPSIVPVYEAGEHGGRHYIAMEYIDGQDLKEAPPPLRRALEIVRDAARAVQFAHDHGVIHRDVKPANLMLSQDGRVFVTDFGLARATAVESTLSTSGMILGTPNYMAPEQAMCATVDARTDVYGLGATLYELVARRMPFDAMALGELLHQVVHDDPVPPRRLVPRLDADIETIILKAMEKDASKRYESAEALAADLERFLSGEPILARRASWPYRLRKRIRRQPVAWGFGALAVLAIVAAAGAGVYYLIEYRRRLEVERAALEAKRLQEVLERSMRRLRQLETELLRRLDDAAYAKARGELTALAGELASVAAEIPGEGSLRYLRGEVYLLLNDEAAAEEEFARAIAAPESEWSRKMSVKPLAAVGRAEALLRDVQDAAVSASPADRRLKMAQARDLLRAIEEGIPEKESALVRLWRLFAEDRVAEIARATAPELAKGGRSEEFHFLRGLVEPDTARRIAYYTEAIDRNHGLARPYFHRGLAHQRLGRWKEAVSDYTDALRLKPDYYEALANRGYARKMSGDVAGGLEDIEALIRRWPKSPGGYLNRGAHYQDLGDLALAEADYDRALAEEPRFVPALTNRGKVKAQRGEAESGLEDLRRAIEIDPTHARAHVFQAEIFIDRGDLDGALAAYEAGVKHAPGELALRVNYGALLNGIKAFAEAEPQFDAALAIDPNCRSALLNRSYTRRMRGNYAGSKGDLETAVAKWPNDAEAPKWREDIVELRKVIEGDF